MNNHFTIISILTSLLFFGSCASYKIQYANDEKEWRTRNLPTKPLAKEVFLVGDIGEEKIGSVAPSLQLMAAQMQQATAKSAIIFLGDNISVGGLPAKKDANRKAIEEQLKLQLTTLKSFKGDVYFIPGNREWEAKNGVKGIRREEKFIQQFLDKGDTFIPDKGCCGPEVEELTDNTVIIAIDSQWFLEDWDKEKDINEDCDIRTRKQFILRLSDKVKDNRLKNIIFLMHHPLYSNGRLGGNFTSKEHLFPLTAIDDNLWLPLPGIGSVFAFFRKNMATPQEVAHPQYQELRDQILHSIKRYTNDSLKNILFVSGHEHSMQFLLEEGQQFIINGAGAERTAVTLNNNATFAAGVMGFSKLYIYEDGEIWTEFYAVSDAKEKILPAAKLIYRKQVKEALPTEEELIPKQFIEYEQLKGQDSIHAAITQKEDLIVYEPFLWGDLYTEEYLTKFKMPILDMTAAGLTVYQLGGGQQTNSIRMKDEQGRLYQLRSVQKATTRMPTVIRKTFLRHFMKQQLTAGNPFGAMVVAPMAEAIGVFHANPKIVYVPQQPNLKEFNPIGGEVYLMEERPEGNWNSLASFGHPEKIINSRKIIEKELKNDKAVIDQALALRTRLLDILIGDWDRHERQVRWGVFKQADGKKLYRPIPSDRDQAFARYDGIFNRLADFTYPSVKAGRVFKEKLNSTEVKWINYQARNYDNFFLNQLTLSDWEREARHIQAHLTDEVIDAAIAQMPPFAYKKWAVFYKKSLQQRRADLLNIARKSYEILNKVVNITGTHKDNLLVVNRKNNFQTTVTIFEYKKDKVTQQHVYERTFENAITDEIRVYGLDGDDQFQVIGTKATKSPLIRLIGGKGKDMYGDNSDVEGLGKRTKIHDDQKEKTQLRLSSEATDKRARLENLNNFDFNWNYYNYLIPIPSIGFNPDDGLYASLKLNWNTFGFKNNQIHQIFGSYAMGSKAVSFSYEGDYFNTFNTWDAYLKVAAEVPRYVRNFHGLGNETVRDVDLLGKDYYRIRRTLYGAHFGVKKRMDVGMVFAIGPAFESIKIQENKNRIIGDEVVGIQIAPTVFNHQYFAGGNVNLSFDNSDDGAIPSHGLGFVLDAEWRSNLEDLNRQLLKLSADFSFTTRLFSKDYLALESRLHASHIYGDFDFFQSTTVGGGTSLRGFARERFSGRSAFYHSSDLRIRLTDSENSFFPFSGGLKPGFDYGRVWSDGQDSQVWHFSYGGGFWIAPLDLISFSAGWFFSKEGNRLAVQANLEF